MPAAAGEARCKITPWTHGISIIDEQKWVSLRCQSYRVNNRPKSLQLIFGYLG